MLLQPLEMRKSPFISHVLKTQTGKAWAYPFGSNGDKSMQKGRNCVFVCVWGLPSTSCGLKIHEQRIALGLFATAVSNVRHCVPPWALQKVSPNIQRTQTGKKLYHCRQNVYDFIFGSMENFCLTGSTNS